MKVSGGIRIDIAAADGYTVSLSKAEHTFNYDKNGNLKGILSDGTISVEVLNGSNPLICDSLAVSPPTLDGTYRVTNILISPSTTLSYNVDRQNNIFRIIPTQIDAEEVMVTFTIVARTNGVNTTFTRQLKYQKSHDGADGYSVSLSKTEHTFNYDKNGNLKGLLSDGAVLVEVMKGSNALICDSLGVLSPTANYTYRVTSITQSPISSFSYNVDRPNNAYRLIPVDMVVDEVEITFTIVARSNDNNTTFTRKIRYQKHRDGADGTGGTDGDSVVHIYKQYPTKPATPSSGVINPTGWSRNPDYPLSIVSQTNWTVNGNWYQSEELTATGNSATSRITFTTYKDAQTITLELWADGHATYDYVYAGKLNTTASTSNYYDRVRGGRIIITYDVPTAGNHYIDIFWRKGISTIVGSNRGYYAIISDVKVWRSTTNVIGGVVQTWSEPQQFDIDTAIEEKIYCLSKTTTAPVISDSDAHINDYIPLPCSLSSYRGDFTTSRAYSIGQVVRYQFEYYKVIKAVTTAYSGNPTNTEYFEKIPGWTDNPVGANKDYPFEFVAIRKKQSDGLWGTFEPSIWSNYGIGTNYIPMGWWDPSITYRMTDLGTPLIKKADGTALGYSVYTLKVAASTPGTFILSEWNLVESAEFIYMQQAYIERLQAELVTADRIEALNIKTGNLEVIDGAKIAGLEIEGSNLVSKNKKLIIDGNSNTIYLRDANSDAIKTMIRPTNIATSVASYFAGATSESGSLSTIKSSYNSSMWNLSTQSITLNASGGRVFEIRVPSLTLFASVRYSGSGNAPFAEMRIVATNGTERHTVGTVVAMSTSGTTTETRAIAARNIPVSTSGQWRLRAELVYSPEALDPSGQITGTATTFSIVEILNRSEIGSNGMMIATSEMNYTYMVGNTFEARRGSKGLRITDSGIEKFNGTSWVASGI